MAKLFSITVKTQADKTVHVVADDQEQAQAKVNLAEGETITGIEDKGDIVQ